MPSHPSSRRFSEVLQERLIAFAVDVCIWARSESGPVVAPVIAQLVRSSTSAAANYAEACAAESRRDFVHKMQICLKELRETRVLLALLTRLDLQRSERPLTECDELIAIFVASIKTARRGLGPHAARTPH